MVLKFERVLTYSVGGLGFGCIILGLIALANWNFYVAWFVFFTGAIFLLMSLIFFSCFRDDWDFAFWLEHNGVRERCVILQYDDFKHGFIDSAGHYELLLVCKRLDDYDGEILYVRTYERDARLFPLGHVCTVNTFNGFSVVVPNSVEKEEIDVRGYYKEQ